jgi:hypothetical protein
MKWVIEMVAEYERWLKELRTQHKGRPYRTLYVFDPKRSAVLLLGGDKSSKKNWYKISVPVAEKRYEGHLRTSKDTGGLGGGHDNKF